MGIVSLTRDSLASLCYRSAPLPSARRRALLLLRCLPVRFLLVLHRQAEVSLHSIAGATGSWRRRDTIQGASSPLGDRSSKVYASSRLQLNRKESYCCQSGDIYLQLSISSPLLVLLANQPNPQLALESLFLLTLDQRTSKDGGAWEVLGGRISWVEGESGEEGGEDAAFQESGVSGSSALTEARGGKELTP